MILQDHCMEISDIVKLNVADYCILFKIQIHLILYSCLCSHLVCEADGHCVQTRPCGSC